MGSPRPSRPRADQSRADDPPGLRRCLRQIGCLRCGQVLGRQAEAVGHLSLRRTGHAQSFHSGGSGGQWSRTHSCRDRTVESAREMRAVTFTNVPVIEAAPSEARNASVATTSASRGAPLQHGQAADDLVDLLGAEPEGSRPASSRTGAPYGRRWPFVPGLRSRDGGAAPLAGRAGGPVWRRPSWTSYGWLSRGAEQPQIAPACS